MPNTCSIDTGTDELLADLDANVAVVTLAC